jgi:hypothetical protein
MIQARSTAPSSNAGIQQGVLGASLYLINSLAYKVVAMPTRTRSNCPDPIPDPTAPPAR